MINICFNVARLREIGLSGENITYDKVSTSDGSPLFFICAHSIQVEILHEASGCVSRSVRPGEELKVKYIIDLIR